MAFKNDVEIRTTLLGKLKGFIEAECGPDLDVTAELINGAPHHEILKYAESTRADLIVVNLQSKGLLERALLGSTAERIILFFVDPWYCRCRSSDRRCLGLSQWPNLQRPDHNPRNPLQASIAIRRQCAALIVLRTQHSNWGCCQTANFSSHAYGVRFSWIHQPPVARYASLTGG